MALVREEMLYDHLNSQVMTIRIWSKNGYTFLPFRCKENTRKYEIATLKIEELVR